MSKNKTPLGRGLGALLADLTTDIRESKTNLSDDDGKSVGVICKIDIAQVRQNPFQPRIDFNKQALDELKNSIEENGVIQPITVRRVPGGFELISGERRVRASIEANMTLIPAYIINVESDREMMELALIENVQRENLNPIEIAIGYQRLIKECDLTQEELGRKISKDRSTVTNTLRLLKLPNEIQESVRHGEITMGHARALLTLQEVELQLEVWQRVVEGTLSVRKTEDLVRQAATAGKAKLKQLLNNNVNATEINNELELTLTEISGRLRQVLGTQVKIKSNNSGSGSVVIDYYSSVDLERLLELFAVLEKNRFNQHLNLIDANINI